MHACSSECVPFGFQYDMDRIEDEWSFENLKVLREIVMDRMAEDVHCAQVCTIKSCTLIACMHITQNLEFLCFHFLNGIFPCLSLLRDNFLKATY